MNAIVAASLGPYGAFLADGSEFTGNYANILSKDYLKKWHKRRLKYIASIPEVDVISFETFPCSIEATAVSELLIEEDINKPVWISFSCRDGSTLNNGEKITDEIKLLDHNPNIIGFGVNCTSPCYILDLIHEMKKSTSKNGIQRIINGNPFMKIDPNLKISVFNGLMLVQVYLGDVADADQRTLKK